MSDVRSWTCKRCEQVTSADHSAGDCISSMRKRLKMQDAEILALKQMREEKRAHPWVAATNADIFVTGFSEWDDACAPLRWRLGHDRSCCVGECTGECLK